MPWVTKRLTSDVLSYWKNQTDLTLEKCSHLDFNFLVPQHLILTLEYTLLCSRLHNQLTMLQTRNQDIDDELVEGLITARKIAIFLAYLYSNKKLHVPREAVRLQKDELFFRTILNQPGSPLQNPLQNPWATVLMKIEDSCLKPTFADLAVALKGRNGIILFRGELFYVDQDKKCLSKIARNAKNQAIVNQLKRLINRPCKVANDDELDLINALTGSAQQSQHKLFNTQLIRNKHVVGNWFRVFSTRGRRLVTNVRPLIAEGCAYHELMDSFEEVATPFFAHFAWAFYLPRLLTNVGILLKHALPHPWMSKEEENLALGIRLNAHFQRRWFELANDSVWLVSGVLCCFLLVGSLLPAASYLVAALYAYDIVTAGLRAFIELRRLYQLRREYNDANVPKELQEELRIHIAYERRRLYLNVGYMAALTVAVALTIPILIASGPLFPLVGAALLVAVTLISFIVLKLNERTKPVTQTPSASPYRFFKAAEESKSSAEPPQEANIDYPTLIS